MISGPIKEHLLKDIVDVKPSIFVGVPIIYNKIQHMILSNQSEKSSFLEKVFKKAGRARR